MHNRLLKLEKRLKPKQRGHISLNRDSQDLMKFITPDGQVYRLDQLKELCQDNHLIVVADQADGATDDVGAALAGTDAKMIVLADVPMTPEQRLNSD